MNDTQDLSRELEAPFSRWTQTGSEHCYITQQACVSNLLEQFREPTSDALLEKLPMIAKLPAELLVACRDFLAIHSLLEGASLLASLTRPARVPPRCERQVEEQDIQLAFIDLINDRGEMASAFDAATGQLPVLAPMCHICANALAEWFVRRHPVLATFEADLAELARNAVINGIMLEFICVRLVHEGNDIDSCLEQVFAKIEPRQTDLDIADLQEIAKLVDRGEIDLEDPRVAELFAHAVPRDALPWPLDRKCACGASLDSSIFCCDAAKPIPPESFQDRLSRTFMLRRDCCGATFDGFRCDLCGRLYTWRKGVAMSLGVDDLQNG